MNASSRNEAISELVNSLESHEGTTLTNHERQLCTTLLHGLTAAGQLRLSAAPVTGGGSDLPEEYDFEAATEGERWAYDQGRDDALNPAKMGLDEIRDALEACVAALTRMSGGDAVEIPE